MFGLLEYKNSWNIGDNCQSIAAEALLPRVDALVDRDTSVITPLHTSDSLLVHVIYNGWFDGNYTKFPLPPNIRPLFVSFHINETDHTNDRSYAHMEKNKLEFSAMGSHRQFFKEFEPIGCRDPHTCAKLKQANIDAYFSACLTLTLENNCNKRTNNIYIVDVHPKNLKFIPLVDLQNAIYITHVTPKQTSHQDKMRQAHELLDKYKAAKKVYTSRLHCLLPCKAFRTDVKFLPDNKEDVRFIGLENLNPQQVVSFARTLRKRVREWVESIHYSGLSIFTACMNRYEHLVQSLPTWVNVHPKEIIIVDWGSNNSQQLEILVNEYRKKQKIILVHVQDVSKWVLTHAFNFAARFASGNILLKVDCDTLLEPIFMCYHNLDAGSIFFAGNWKTARDVNERHTNGVFLVRRQHFFQVGGFNEFITTYGYDDCKLYFDLEGIGLSRTDLQRDTMKHILHSNSMRINNQKVNHSLDVEIECNRLICQSSGRSHLFSDIQWIRFNIFRYQSSVTVDEKIKKSCLERAIINRSKFKKKLYVQVQNGLGNRLRTLASAYNIAMSSQRQLVLVWITDFHCFAKFQDLFETVPEIMMLESMPILDKKTDILKGGCESICGVDIYDYVKTKDKYINDDSINDIYVSSACVLNNKNTSWSKESIFLKSLKPLSCIQSKLDAFCMKHDIKDMIGVHIRMSQQNTPHDDISNYANQTKIAITKWRTASHWEVFAKEMERHRETSPQQKFLVCCDTPTSKIELTKRLGNGIVCYDEELYDRSPQQIQIALIEVILLSKTKLILGSNWSTFSELARRLGSSTSKLAGIDF